MRITSDPLPDDRRGRPRLPKPDLEPAGSATVGDAPTSQDAVPVSRVSDLDVLNEIHAKALAACRRLRKLYECATAWQEAGGGPDHRDIVRDEGLWLLRVLEGRDTDRKPELRDPAELWKTASRLLDRRVARPTPALPDPPTFATRVPSQSSVRRKPEPYALKAAIFATSLLLEDLADCREPTSEPPEHRTRGRATDEREYAWAAVCERLGDRGEAHFGVLEQRLGEELQAAALWLTGRSPPPASAERGPARYVGRGGPIRPDGFGWDESEKFKLPPTQFFLLWELWEHLNEPVSFDVLAESVWGERDPRYVLDYATLKNHLTPLRAWLRDGRFPFQIDQADRTLTLAGPLDEGPAE